MYLDKIIAHRGYSSAYPENTLLAFEKAIELGVTCIETDVTILKDGTLVLFHDYLTNDHTNYQGIIHDLSAQSIQEVDAGSWKNKQFENLRIPTLTQLLELAKKTNTRLNLELKGEASQNEQYWDSIVEKTIETVHQMNVQDLVFYSSFEFPMLRTLKSLDPKALFGILLWEETDHWKEIADELHPQAIHLYDKTVTPSLIADIKKENYEIYVYTVNDQESVEQFFKMGVDGIFTDKPNLFI
ncbi:MAG: glycerophosphodiester phosphodiesterase [Brevinema sp.]